MSQRAARGFICGARRQLRNEGRHEIDKGTDSAVYDNPRGRQRRACKSKRNAREHEDARRKAKWSRKDRKDDIKRVKQKKNPGEGTERT